MCECALNSCGPGYGLVLDSCKRGNEALSSAAGEESLY
jgi:hypothetical protein